MSYTQPPFLIPQFQGFSPSLVIQSRLVTMQPFGQHHKYIALWRATVQEVPLAEGPLGMGLIGPDDFSGSGAEKQRASGGVHTQLGPGSCSHRLL